MQARVPLEWQAGRTCSALSSERPFPVVGGRDCSRTCPNQQYTKLADRRSLEFYYLCVGMTVIPKQFRDVSENGTTRNGSRASVQRWKKEQQLQKEQTTPVELQGKHLDENMDDALNLDPDRLTVQSLDTRGRSRSPPNINRNGADGGVPSDGKENREEWLKCVRLNGSAWCSEDVLREQKRFRVKCFFSIEHRLRGEVKGRGYVAHQGHTVSIVDGL